MVARTEVGLDLEPERVVQLLELGLLVVAAVDVVVGLIALVVSCVSAAGPYVPVDREYPELAVAASPSAVVLPFVDATAVSLGLVMRSGFLHVAEPCVALRTVKPAAVAAEDVAEGSQG